MLYNLPVYLKEVDWPDYGKAAPVIYPAEQELRQRIENCRREMQQRGLTHLLVYGDREHFANLHYLVHFDPRFEEALLVIGREQDPLLLVGNECVSHLPVSPLYQAGAMRHERYQPFSLLSQPRSSSRSLAAILESEGIAAQSAVGCIGWKYFSSAEFDRPDTTIDLPSFITDTVRAICSEGRVVNATDILQSPAYGLKTNCSPFEIAHFEFSNGMAAAGMRHLLRHFQTGITDFELAARYQPTGYPLGCHTGLKSSANLHIGLSSPAGGEIRLGDPCSTNLSYWGSNICRAGWVARSETDLPETARGYIDAFAAPYFRACAAWLQTLRIGTRGKELYALTQQLLPFDRFAVFLNPGHLIHYEEWVSSPIYEGSEDEIRSGMYLQLDIIPRSGQYFSSRMEDGYIVADEDLQAALQSAYPEVYRRCMARRAFMEEVLGFSLPPEVLPLSDTAGLVPPFFLHHRQVLSLKP